MKRRLIAETHGFHLARNEVVGLDGAPGTELHVHRGAVWLTQQDDARDIVLRPGEAFRLDRRGRAVMQVLADAEISLRTSAR